jgi:hypothetical protein
MKIIFDNSSKDWILDVFNKSVDADGFIIENNSNSERVLTPEGKEIHSRELAIIKKGSQKFIAGDLTSLMKFTKNEI